MKTPRILLLLLITVFILFEILFLYYVYLEGNLAELPGTGIKTLFFLGLIFLYSRKMTWARWTLSIVLVFYGILCLVVAIEAGYIIFYAMALYHIFFAVFIHTSSILRQHYSKARISQEANATIPRVDLPADSFMINNQVYKYPRLLKRYKALLIDGFLLLTIMIIVMIVTNDHEYHTPIMIVTWLLAGFLYEPLLTTYSKTVGQWFMGIAVRDHRDPSKRINLGYAYLRILLKGLLGWLSFITIHFNPEHRAIHDFASDSVMIDD